MQPVVYGATAVTSAFTSAVTSAITSAFTSALRNPYTPATWPPLPPPIRVTRDDLAVIATTDPTSATGYDGVYMRAENHEVRYVGKAFKRPCGPVRTTPRQSAEDIIYWWKRHFGDRWQQFYAARRVRGSAIIPDDCGWRVIVWVMGRMEYVGQDGRKPRGELFATRADAEAGLKRWVKGRFGLFAPASHLVLRRCVVPRRPAR